jgi:hypothetical protein
VYTAFSGLRISSSDKLQKERNRKQIALVPVSMLKDKIKKQRKIADLSNL